MSQEDKAIFISAIGAVILIVGVAFCFAYAEEQDKVDCIANGYVYIEDHCYKNLPVERK